MVTIGDRLRSAVEMRGLSLRELHRRLEKACSDLEISGTSYAAFHNYLRDRREPPIPLLQVAAAILDVRPEWLVLGRGRPTRQEEEMEERRLPPDDAQVATERAVPEFKSWPAAVQSMFRFTLSRWIQAARDGDTATKEHVHDLAEWLRLLVLVPLSLWNFDRHIDEHVFVVYATGMLQALMTGMVRPGTGQRLARRYENLLIFEVVTATWENLARVYPDTYSVESDET